MGILKATDGTLHIAGLDAPSRIASRQATDRLFCRTIRSSIPISPAASCGAQRRDARARSCGSDGGDHARRTSDSGWRTISTTTPRIFSRDEEEARPAPGDAASSAPLILDEPTNGLDVESTHLFYDMIVEAAAGGTTVVFSPI